MLKTALAAAAVVALTGAGASAATITYTNSLANQSTAYNNIALSLQKFSNGLGTLNSVTFSLTGFVSGNVSAESLDALPANVGLNLGAQVTAATAISPLAVVIPTATQVFAASAFDGVMDFGGTSGTSITGLTAAKSTSVLLTGGSMLEFIGGGTINILISASSQSSSTGSGNLVTMFQTLAGANVSVTYDYTEAPAPVPLPAGMPLLLAGLGALGLARSRRA